MTRWPAAIGAVWLTAAVMVAASAGEIRVTPIVTDRQVAASFVAPGSFTDDTRDVLQSGLLLTFTFSVDLRRPSGLWWDRTLATATVGATGKFDNLTGVYQVSKSQDGHVVWSDRTTDLADVRAWMTSFDRVPLEVTDPLEPNTEYYIHVRLRASPRRAFSLWPWSGDDGAGRAEFTKLR